MKSFNNSSFLEELDQEVNPILPEVEIATNEENEEELFKIRAKLFRYDSTSQPHEWKERGTGDVKLLRNRENDRVRVVMRRDRTLKICANHFIMPWMQLRTCMTSDRAWVYSAPVDFADEKPTPELLAIKFTNVENAKAWKKAFDNAREIVAAALKKENKDADGDKKSSPQNESPESSSSLSQSDSEEQNSEKKEMEKSKTEEIVKDDKETTELAKELENKLEVKSETTSTGDST